jgi:hypothetical protein
MRPTWKSAGVIGFVFHFLIILLACSRDFLVSVATDSTLVPTAWRDSMGEAGALVSRVFGEERSKGERRALRESTILYAHLAGIEYGYGFFAPNVPESHKLVFELRYRDGRVQRKLPSVGTAGFGLRLTCLYDNLASTSYEPLRVLILKMLVAPVLREGEEPVQVRAVFGNVEIPTLAQYKQGRRVAYQPLFVYNFRPLLRHSSDSGSLP